MKSFCDVIKELILQREYLYIYVACENFEQSIQATRELIDSGIVTHGSCGASKKIYNGQTYYDTEWNFPYINTNTFELEYRRSIDSVTFDGVKTVIVRYSDFIADEILNPPDIGGFLGI